MIPLLFALVVTLVFAVMLVALLLAIRLQRPAPPLEKDVPRTWE